MKSTKPRNGHEITLLVPSVGAEIKTRRTAKGWTQDELARRMSLDRSRLSAIENDDTGVRVTVAESQRFERVLGLPVEAWTRWGQR